MFIQMPNSREAAYIILFLLFLTLAFYYKQGRVHLINMLKVFLVKEILVLLFAAIFYSILGVYIFYWFGLWEITLLKDVIKWFIFSALVALANTIETEDGKTYFKSAIISNLSLTVIVSFILDKFTFHLIIEVLLVIVILFIRGVLYSASKEEKYKDVKIIFNIILSVVSGILLLNSLNQLFSKPDDFFNMSTLKEFLLPVFLGFWLIPFTYILYLWKIYERVFANINLIVTNKKLSEFTKITSMIKFKGDTVGLRRWRDSLFNFDIKSETDIFQSIFEIKERQKMEQNPIEISSEIGWSPFIAKDYLKSVGIETSFHKNGFDGEWSASSKYIYLDDEIIPSNVAYYVKGDSMIAKQLKLVLNINSKLTEEDALIAFVKYCEVLFQKVTGTGLPESLIRGIVNKRKAKIHCENISVLVEKVDWLRKEKGYTINFIVYHVA